MTPRTLRAANCSFYLATILLVLVASAYVLTRPAAQTIQLVAAGAGILGSLAWGCACLALRYRVDGEGIEHRSLRGTTRFRWADGVEAELVCIQTPGEESRTIILHSAGRQMRISSEQLALEAVEELEQDLRTLGIPFLG